MEVEVNISYEVIGIARAVTSGWMNPERNAAYRDAQKAVQLAINSATAPLQKEIERLRGEIDAAWFEARRGYSISDEDLFVTWEASRAKRVAEGKE